MLGGCAAAEDTAASSGGTADGATVEYTTYPSSAGDRAMDVWRPVGAAGARHPVLLLVHGGGFASGDRSELDGAARAAAGAGFTAVNIDYRLEPGAAQVEDVLAAVGTVTADPERFGVDPERVALLGSSAGGTLASLAGIALGERARAVIGWSGAYDFREPTVGAYDPGLVVAGSQFVGCDLRDAACRGGRAVAASPAAGVRADSPPVLLVNSTSELMPLEQLRFMEQAQQRAGRPVRVLVLDGERHASVYAGDALGASLDFVRENLR